MIRETLLGRNLFNFNVLESEFLASCRVAAPSIISSLSSATEKDEIISSSSAKLLTLSCFQPALRFYKLA